MKRITQGIAVAMLVGMLAVLWSMPAAAADSIVVNVPAYAESSSTQQANPWKASGVTLAPGASITVTASGSARTSPSSGTTGPNGTGGSCHSLCLAPGLSVYGLVARVGSSGAIQFVGVGPTTITNTGTAAGEVFFAYNDHLNIYHDNSGSYDVTIQGIYDVCVLHDESKAVKSGATFPLKLQLCDGGSNLSSEALVLNAQGLKRDGLGAGDLVEDAGSANPDDNFRYSADLEGYIFNKSTKGLSSGTWELSFSVNGVSYSGYTVQFGVK